MLFSWTQELERSPCGSLLSSLPIHLKTEGEGAATVASSREDSPAEELDAPPPRWEI